MLRRKRIVAFVLILGACLVLFYVNQADHPTPAKVIPSKTKSGPTTPESHVVSLHRLLYVSVRISTNCFDVIFLIAEPFDRHHLSNQQPSGAEYRAARSRSRPAKCPSELAAARHFLQPPALGEKCRLQARPSDQTGLRSLRSHPFIFRRRRIFVGRRRKVRLVSQLLQNRPISQKPSL